MLAVLKMYKYERTKCANELNVLNKLNCYKIVSIMKLGHVLKCAKNFLLAISLMTPGKIFTSN